MLVDNLFEKSNSLVCFVKDSKFFSRILYIDRKNLSDAVLRKNIRWLDGLAWRPTKQANRNELIAPFGQFFVGPLEFRAQTMPHHQFVQ